MNTSKTIAALLGPVFLVTGLMVLLNLDAFPAIVKTIGDMPLILMLSGYMTFVPGLAIVIVHNRWNGGWPVLVTLCGWLFLIVGLIRIVFAFRLAGMIGPMAGLVIPAMPVFGVLVLLVGAYLSFQGFRRA